LNANVNDEIIASEELSEWPTLSKLQYCEVSLMLEGQEEPVVALKDSGAEISLIHQDLIKDRPDNTGTSNRRQLDVVIGLYGVYVGKRSWRRYIRRHIYVSQRVGV